ncbi:hypothetical protein S7711_10421 [Stachybotrys chartarum IBT 7711]|uniref:Uncharacterized protein n=1 Tax=Stachybotrys chartarum (strain CBS 109288 / IBT 7711) TaxID=1280523 RepID=A0A084B4F9_STACB|nr:hypothetical protein S7711_10421 [Stachybotrys chartarum IBT 7711]
MGFSVHLEPCTLYHEYGSFLSKNINVYQTARRVVSPSWWHHLGCGSVHQPWTRSIASDTPKARIGAQVLPTDGYEVRPQVNREDRGDKRGYFHEPEMGRNPSVLVHKRRAKGTWDVTIARGRTQLGLRDFAGKYSGQSSVDPGKGTSFDADDGAAERGARSRAKSWAGHAGRAMSRLSVPRLQLKGVFPSPSVVRCLDLARTASEKHRRENIQSTIFDWWLAGCGLSGAGLQTRSLARDRTVQAHFLLPSVLARYAFQGRVGHSVGHWCLTVRLLPAFSLLPPLVPVEVDFSTKQLRYFPPPTRRQFQVTCDRGTYISLPILSRPKAVPEHRVKHFGTLDGVLGPAPSYLLLSTSTSPVPSGGIPGTPLLHLWRSTDDKLLPPPLLSRRAPLLPRPPIL